MRITFTEEQKTGLKELWRSHDGLARLEEDFLIRLENIVNSIPPIIDSSNKKIETAESLAYKKIADACVTLIEALEDIPSLDRLNNLSIREKRDDYGGKILPIIDPLDYTLGTKEAADWHSQFLATYKKYERQLYRLRDGIAIFPPLRNVSRKAFIDLACIIWPNVNEDSFTRAYRPWKKAEQIKRISSITEEDLSEEN